MPFRFEKLARELEDKIANGTYGPGRKLPSVQRLRQQTNLSAGTVHRALIELERKGRVEARPKSGFYVLDPGPMRQAADVSGNMADIPAAAREIRERMKDSRLVPFGPAVVSPDLLPCRDFTKILKSVSAVEMRSMVGYGAPEGSLELRREIAARTVAMEHGIGADDVIITNGCLEGVGLALRAITRPGDAVAIESPTYFGFLPILEELGVRPVGVKTHPETGLDLNDLRHILDTHDIKACLLVPNFQNPLGALMPDANKKKLARMLAERRIPVIEDDIYAELHSGKQRPRPLKSFDADDRVLTCASISKTLAPGFRIGWILPGKRYKDDILRLKAGRSLSTSNLDQHLLAEFLAGHGYERHLRTLRKILRGQIEETSQLIRKHFPSGTEVSRPAGGFALWVRLPAGVDSMDLWRRAVRKGLCFLPGAVCSFDGAHAGYIRICCGYPLDTRLRKAIARLGALVAEPKPGV